MRLALQLSLVWRTLFALAALTVVAAVVLATAATVVGLVALAAVLLVVAVVAWDELPTLLGTGVDVLGHSVGLPAVVVGVTGLLLAPVLYLRPVRAEIRSFRSELRGEGTAALKRHPEIAGMAQRLAQQADIPAPTVFIVNRRRPESYAFGGRRNGTIVITRGVIRPLSDAELKAVLAHEISHLANGDSRIMNAALAPLLVAEHVEMDEPPKLPGMMPIEPLSLLGRYLLWSVLTGLTRTQQALCRFGISFLSRGREFAADRGAARLTGSPAALASALRTLDDARGTPSEDKRTWARSAGALDILPQGDPMATLGLFRTHPRTETRIARLERLAAASRE